MSMWEPPKPIKFTSPKVDKKTGSTLKNLGKGRLGQLADSVRATNTSPRHMEAKADLLNAQRLAQKHQFQSDLATKVVKAEQNLSRTGEALQHLGAGKPYGAS